MVKKGSKRKADLDDGDFELDDEEELELEIIEHGAPEFKVLGFIYDHITSSLTATQMKLSGMKRVLLSESHQLNLDELEESCMEEALALAAQGLASAPSTWKGVNIKALCLFEVSVPSSGKGAILEGIGTSQFHSHLTKLISEWQRIPKPKQP
jgi:hypothetical protein